MSKLKPPEKHGELLKKKFWSIKDLFWLLLGNFGFNNVVSIVQGEHSKYSELAKELKKAANQGRFGKLINSDDPDLFEEPPGVYFFWGVEMPFEFEDQYAEMGYQESLQRLNALPTFQVHPMRIINWVEDENIYRLIPQTRSKELKKLANDFRRKRSDCITPLDHSIDWMVFAKEFFWAKTDFWIVLFGQTRAVMYPSKEYWKFNSDCEKALEEIDRFIDDAVKLKKIQSYSMEKSKWKPLVRHKEFDTRWDCEPLGMTYSGFYDYQEATLSSSMYSPFELIRLIQTKGFCVPDGLLEAFENNEDQNNIIELLKKLQKNILLPEPHDSKTSKSHSGIKRGRATLPAKYPVMEEALKLRKNYPTRSIPKIARHSSILKVLKPGSPLPDLKNLDSKEYQKEFHERFNVSLRTVEGWIREAFLLNPLS